MWPLQKMLAMCGVDPAIELLKIGQPVQKQSNMANARGEALPFRDSLFNIVLCLTAFHNFDDYPKGIEQMKRISTDDATIIITILKKISMAEKLGKMIHDEFDVVKELDDLHDNIYICNKKKAQ
jgi:ubiquinone/menaquinone biosynthesis C-methylase UbiE